MSLSTTEIIIGAAAGIATIFGLFGVAMVSLGRSREKLDRLKADMTKLERDFKDDVKDLQKDVKDISIKVLAYTLARREEEKVGQDKNE
jgi:hypothetical protein